MIFPNLVISFAFFYFLHHSQALHLHLDNSTDRDALLSFKSSVTSDPHGALDSWHPNTSFCHWRGVLCNPIKQRVTSLTLRNCSLVGTISPHITNLSFLQILDLTNNYFSGIISFDIHRLFRLKILDLYSNNLHGSIPPSLSQCSRLRVVDLSMNNLNGTIPSELGSLSKLQFLGLEVNKLSGFIPSSFSNLSSLYTLALGRNRIQGPIPSELGRLNRLLHLNLGNNSISGSLPVELMNMSSLKTLELALNEIIGNLPSNLFNGLANLRRALMGINKLRGHIPESLSNASNLEQLDLSSNQFSGKMNPKLWKLEKIEMINLEINFLTSDGEEGMNFIASLTNSTSLQVLSVTKNLLTGQLPPAIGNLSSQLYMLLMSENKLTGNIPEEMGNLAGLTILSMDTNSFTGKIPSSLGNIQELQALNLYNNFLSGSIPETLGNLSILSEIGLNDNNLTGVLPPSFSNCKQIQIFDVSANGLSGTLPKEILISFASLGELFDVSSNNFYGSLPSEIGKMSMVQHLYVLRNHFSGPIPDTIKGCLNLQSLDMSRNSFQGPIPSSLAELKGIESIDLSSNNLSGKIPPLDGLRYLQYLNLSYNKLQGEVPKTGVFLNMSAIFLSNNSELCGGIVEFQLPKCIANTTSKRRNKKLIKGLVAGGVVLCVVIILGSVVTLRLMRRKKLKSMATDVILFEGPHRLYSYFELKYATRNFGHENLMGKGSFGSVYKGVMRDGTSVAIKVFNLDQRGAIKSFLAECEVFRNIRHRNLVKILSACSNIDFKALVLEYMPNGNLEDWLHKRRDGWLNLKQRIDIAIDVAAAIEYLHNGLETPVVHCDLKPSNVLLDDNMTAFVGDFGLARMLQNQGNSTNQKQSSTIGLKGSIGYIPPEYGQGAQISTEGDVYSYGILLLEIFTGRSPVEEMFCGEMNLQRWVLAAIPNEVVTILDEKLNAYSFKVQMIDRLSSIINIGLKCASESPDVRPLMKDVSATIKKIQSRLFREVSSIQNSHLIT